MINKMDVAEAYRNLKDNPLLLISDMTFDDYCDWLDLGTKEDLEITLALFKEKNIPEDYIRVLKYKLDKI